MRCNKINLRDVIDSDEDIDPFKVIKRRRYLRECKKMKNNSIDVKKKFRSRLVYPKRDCRLSPWWEYTLGGAYADPESRDEKHFRNRFRVPYSFYKKLLEMAEPWYPKRLAADLAAADCALACRFGS